MLAICKSILGGDIPPSGRYLGEMDQTNYSPLIVGEGYMVYGLLFLFDRVGFLVRAPEQPPFWVPSHLFDLIDTKVPAGWEFRITQGCADYKALFDAFGINYIMGYPLLANEYRHYVGLVERDSREIQRFLEFKME